MGIIGAHTLHFKTVKPTEHKGFLDFVDHSFERSNGRAMVHDFPTALGKNNLKHQYIGTLDGEPVCAAAVLLRDWYTSEGVLRTACLGCLITPPAYRGRGYNAALQQWVLGRLAEEGAAWAVLWTDRPEVYTGRGFRPAGRELHGWLQELSWPSASVGQRIRRAQTADAPQLLALYRQHRLRAERSVADLRAHLDPRVSTVLVLEEADRILAYAAIGRAQEFSNHVHDYGGDVQHVHILWGEAARRGARYVLVCEGAERFLGGAAHHMPRRIQTVGLARVLDPSRLGVGLDALEWAAWGFDSA
jgi:predicted N-acetyltransferase YhbS